VYPEKTQFALNVAGRTIKVSMERNHRLFGPNYHETILDYRGKTLMAMTPRARTTKDRGCVYLGTTIVDGVVHGSNLALDVCAGGFRGSFIVDGVQYAIEPASRHFNEHAINAHLEAAKSRHAQSLSYNKDAEPVKGALHLVYKRTDHIRPESYTDFCGVQGNTEAQHDHTHPVTLDAAAAPTDVHTHTHMSTTTSSSSSFSNAHSPFRTQTVADHLIVELTVVNDYRRATFLNMNGGLGFAGAPEMDSVSIVNEAAARYLTSFSALDPTVVVVLVGQYTFLYGDPYTPAAYSSNPSEVSVDSLLPLFHAWVNSCNNITACDNHHLLSGYDFQSTVLGYAGVSTMCQSLSGGIDQTIMDDANFNGAVLAHEMGHNFGMQHDSVGNACPVSGYVMNAQVSTPPTNFSDCSITYWRNFINNYPTTCLDNEPAVVWGGKNCGNGYIEVGEECDCGPGGCANRDPCCNGTTCMLFDFAHCSNLQPCCSNCTVRAASENHLCRGTVSTCDIAEYCDGTHGACPADVVKGAGNTCTDPTDGAGVCYQASCMSLQRDCRIKGAAFSPPITSACDNPDPSNGDAFCAAVQCESSSSSQCVTFNTGASGSGPEGVVATSDGVACGNNKQCFGGRCVDSATFNPLASWRALPWQPCSSCDVPQMRSLECRVQMADSFASVVVPDAVCSPSGRQTTTQPCQDVTPPCISAPHDTDLDRYARNLADEFGALDKAAALRNAVPRVPGYPTEFSTTDPEYRKGIELMAVPEFVLAGVALIVWIAWCACLKDKYDDQNRDRERISDGGYTSSQKCCPLVFAWVFVLLMVVFACLGFFYNGELRRGCCDESAGATVLMRQILQDAVQLSDDLSPSINYLNQSLFQVVGQARNDITPVALHFTAGTLQARTALTTLSNHYNGFVEEVPTFGTIMATNFSCAFCQGLGAKIAAINAQLLALDTAMAASTLAVNNVSDTLHALQNVLWFGNDRELLNQAVNQLNEVAQQATEQQSFVDDATDKAEYADKIFHPFCIIFLAFVLIVFVLTVLYGFCFRSKAESGFGAVVQLDFFLNVGSLILLGFAVPLMTATGDSCLYLNKAEQDVSGTLNVSVTAGRIIQACLINAPLSPALNLTDALTGVSQLVFLPISAPPISSALLNALASNSTGISTADAFPTWGGTALADSDLMQINTITSGTFSRSNVATMDPMAYAGNEAALTDLKGHVLFLIDLETSLPLFVTYFKGNLTWVQSILGNLSATLNADVATYNSVGIGSSSLTAPLMAATSFLLQNDNCGTLGDDYHAFKTAWFDVMTTSFSFLGLAFFVITLAAIPALVLSRKLAWRLPASGPKPVSELEFVEGRYS